MSTLPRIGINQIRSLERQMIKVSSLLILFAAIFAFLYFEDRVFIFGVSLSNIWKFSVVIILGFLIILKFNLKIPRLFAVSMIFALSFAINGALQFSITDLETIVLSLVLPISYYGFYSFGHRHPARVRFVLLSASCFFLLSAVPFILNLVQPPVGIGEGLEEFGESYQFSNQMFIGLFKHPSISAKIVAVSTAIVATLGMLDQRSSNIAKMVFFLIVILGMYCIYLSFTRTGWLMIATFFGFYILRNGKSSFVQKAILVGVLGFLIFGLFEFNDVFRNRLMGIREGAVRSADALTIFSSGRNIIIMQLLEVMARGDFFTQCFGLGSEQFIELNDGGAAHNKFLEFFVLGGVVSLLLYVLFIFKVSREIALYRSESVVYYSVVGVFWMFMIAALFSHGLGVYGDTLFGGLIALNRMTAV